MFNPFNWFSSPGNPRSGLTAAQEKMYALEQNDNFRWASKAFALRSKHTLTSSSLASPSLVTYLASLGQFAELAHGSLNPRFIWSNMDKLTSEGFPLEGYDALHESELVDSFRGTVADLQGYVAYRPQQKQLIVSFSGTSSIQQALQDVTAIMTPHPGRRGASVHLGFWNMYGGVKQSVLNALRKGMEKYSSDVQEIVLTAHSMGGVMCYFLAIDLLTSSSDLLSNAKNLKLKLQLALYGCPRVGNDPFVAYWQDLVSRSSLPPSSPPSSPSLSGRPRLELNEYSVRAYNDGATCLPPYFLGYRHLAKSPLYSSHDALFQIPPEDAECCHFEVDLSSKPETTDTPEPRVPPSRTPQFPYGGHNYYNARDMEKLIRRMGWLELDKHGENGWEERFVIARDSKEAKQ